VINAELTNYDKLERDQLANNQIKPN